LTAIGAYRDRRDCEPTGSRRQHDIAVDDRGSDLEVDHLDLGGLPRQSDLQPLHWDLLGNLRPTGSRDRHLKLSHLTEVDLRACHPRAHGDIGGENPWKRGATAGADDESEGERNRRDLGTA